MNWFYAILSWVGLGGLRRAAGKQPIGPGSYATSAAQTVTFETAMQVSAFWACVRLISESIACLPVVVYRIENGVRRRDETHWLHALFAHKPNRYQTTVEFLETMAMNLCARGNCYAQITRNVSGQVVSLLPLMSQQVEVELLPDGAVVYLYQSDRGVQVFAAENIWHIKLFGNGIVGLSPLDYARNSIGIAQASETRVTSIFRNGAKPTGVLMVDSALTKDQRQAIRESFQDLAEGNEDSLIVLDKFMKYEQVSMSPQDIELLQSRRFQLEDIARFFNVPSILINDASQSTVWGSGIQQLIQGWYKLGLRPYLERIERSAQAHLLSPAERTRYEIELDFDALLRVDQPTRMDGYQKAINSGQITPNEARQLEGRPPLPGGDQLLVQGAMVPIEMAGRQKQTQVVNDGT